jgi:hypothetical protein
MDLYYHLVKTSRLQYSRGINKQTYFSFIFFILNGRQVYNSHEAEIEILRKFSSEDVFIYIYIFLCSVKTFSHLKIIPTHWLKKWG